jgi:hypothetical protein
MDNLVFSAAIHDAFTLAAGGLEVKFGVNDGETIPALALMTCLREDVLLRLDLVLKERSEEPAGSFLAKVVKVKTSKEWGLEFWFVIIEDESHAFAIFNSAKADERLINVFVRQATEEEQYALESRRIRKSERKTAERENLSRSISQRISQRRETQ